MSKCIRITPDVAAKLKEQAQPGENANAVLRRLLGFPPRKPGPRAKAIR